MFGLVSLMICRLKALAIEEAGDPSDSDVRASAKDGSYIHILYQGNVMDR